MGNPEASAQWFDKNHICADSAVPRGPLFPCIPVLNRGESSLGAQPRDKRMNGNDQTM
jgi:hypothetical protein